MIHPGVLERIAAALETIADALTGQNPPAAAPRTRPRRPDAQFEWEPDNDQIPTAPLPEPGPAEERCGFLIEQFTHALDRSTVVYQLSKAGVTDILTAQEGAHLATLDDDEFIVTASARLADVLAQRHSEMRAEFEFVGRTAPPTDSGPEPEDDDERREREWARTIARADT